VPDSTRTNGEHAKSAVVAIVTRRRRVSSHANQYTAPVAAAADTARAGSVEPVTTRTAARNAGHSGWYLNTTRPSSTPERKGRKYGSWVDAGRVSRPARSASACERYATSSKLGDPSGKTRTATITAAIPLKAVRSTPQRCVRSRCHPCPAATVEP
jgi:hypothetical protein